MPAPVLIDDFLELGYKSAVLTRRAVADYLDKPHQAGESPDTPQQAASPSAASTACSRVSAPAAPASAGGEGRYPHGA